MGALVVPGSGARRGAGRPLHLRNTHARARARAHTHTHTHTHRGSVSHSFTEAHTRTHRGGSIRPRPRPAALRDQHWGQRQSPACGGGVRAGPAPVCLSRGSCLAAEQVGAAGTPSPSSMLIPIPREVCVCVCVCARGGGDTGETNRWRGGLEPDSERTGLRDGCGDKEPRGKEAQAGERVQDLGRLGPDSRQRPANPDGGAARSRWGDGQK